MLASQLVLDASVLVELVLSGRHRKAAQSIIQNQLEDRPAELVSTSHALAEALNAVRNHVLRSELDREGGWLCFLRLQRLRLTTDSPRLHLKRIWQLIDVMTTYDATYAAAAEARDVPLITADRRLVKACKTASIEALHLDQLTF